MMFASTPPLDEDISFSHNPWTPKGCEISLPFAAQLNAAHNAANPGPPQLDSSCALFVPGARSHGEQNWQGGSFEPTPLDSYSGHWLE